MFSAKALLHPRRRADGTAQVRVRLTKDRQSAFWDAGFTLSPKHWNDGPAAAVNQTWVRAGEVDHARLNKRLDGMVRQAKAEAEAHPNLSAVELRDRLAVASGAVVKPATKERADGLPTDLVEFARWYVASREKTDNPNTVKFYRETARDLAAWRGGEPLPFAGFSGAHLREFHDYLLARPGLFPGTARDRMVKLSTIVLRAVRLGLLDAAKNPFPDYELPKVGNKKPPVRPTDEQRKAVLAYDLSGFVMQNHPRFRASLEVCRDVWHLQYLVRGTRCGDIISLRERDIRPDRISFTEIKNGKLKNVARSPAINALLARYPPTGNPLAYVFPLLDHRKPYAAEHPTHEQLTRRKAVLRDWVGRMGKRLRTIAELVGVPPFATHSARHMYSERAYAKTKDLRLVQTMLNHSDIAVTERYLKTLGYDALDAATESILADD